MYLESYPGDTNCEVYCGPSLPYMIYDGDPFCAQDLNEQGKWLYVDYSLNPIWYSTDPPIVVTCYGMRVIYKIQINMEHGNILV